MTLFSSFFFFFFALGKAANIIRSEKDDDDPDADEIALFLVESDRMAAAATWPARDDTVAARVRKRRRS